MTEQLLTVAEVAERLSLNPETVRRWCRTGRLPGVPVGGPRRLPDSGVGRRGAGPSQRMLRARRRRCKLWPMLKRCPAAHALPATRAIALLSPPSMAFRSASAVITNSSKPTCWGNRLPNCRPIC